MSSLTRDMRDNSDSSPLPSKKPAVNLRAVSDMVSEYLDGRLPGGVHCLVLLAYDDGTKTDLAFPTNTTRKAGVNMVAAYLKNVEENEFGRKS